MSLKIEVLPSLKNVSFSIKKSVTLNAKATTFLLYPFQSKKTLEKGLKLFLAPYQMSELKSHDAGVLSFQTPKGKLVLCVYKDKELDSISDHEGLLEASIYAQARDYLGEALCQLDLSKPQQAQVYLYECNYEASIGALTGLELSMYRYKKSPYTPEFKIYGVGLPSKEALNEAITSASHIGKGINVARFLVDTPPNLKKPSDYAKALNQFFSKKKGVTVDIWDAEKLKKEKMNLLLSVGQGAEQPAHLVHLKYRPTSMKAPMRPIAFVGKGITFDSGGLDIKPSSGMRLMKKDMGGSATLAGLASWVVESGLKVPCDFYFSLAENAVSSKSFRPSDIIEARNGLKVEIDNTDAEGRLALADALSLATEKKGSDKPLYVIDVATLTGAVKVGLGSDIGGLFSNDDDLAFLIQDCSQMAGDLLWRLPLMKSQRTKLESPFADMANSASGFGGAIRAAMFLKEFVKDIPWAHLDIYAWNDSAQKAYAHAGGSGQAVQCLAQFLSQFEQD